MKSFSEETRRKRSESAKKRCADPAWLEAQRKRGTQLNAEEVKNMYERGMTQAEIAVALNITQKVVFNFMRRHGIKARKAAKRDQTRENNACWKGGERIEGGYKCLYIPGHHKARSNGYVREHDLIAEEMIGRPLRWFGPQDSRSEVVHHINGDKLDNSPEIFSSYLHNSIEPYIMRLLRTWLTRRCCKEYMTLRPKLKKSSAPTVRSAAAGRARLSRSPSP